MSDLPLVLHLNGAPGVGKSTLARRWAETHPGTLVVEADALRTWVSGWREDFVAIGAPVREVALAMIAAWVATGHDVVLPQLVASAGELERFRTAATGAGGQFVEVVLVAGGEEPDRRFHARDRSEPWLEVVADLVAAAGPTHLADLRARVAQLARATPDAVVLETADGDPAATYDVVVAAVTHAREGPASGIPR